jgi:mannitol/fructose-specific phosphotransferase system IIA component (Ntr-type)
MSAFGFDIDPALVTIVRGPMGKCAALDQLIEVMADHPAIIDDDAFRNAIFERESCMSTGIGGGVAIPHVRMAGIAHVIVGIGVAPDGIEYTTLDCQPVYLMILFATPEGGDKEYLRRLAQVMAALRADHGIVDRVRRCEDPEQVVALLNA